MMHASPRGGAMAKASEDHAWRRRTLTACGLAAFIVIAAAAAGPD
jgi:hypothetical protein